MEDSNEILIDKVMKYITEDNIDEKLLFYSSLLERLMNKKECYDININTSVKHRACKKPMKKLKLEFLELVSDEDSSSDYLPSSEDESNEDSDE
jgi:4-hydroxyphenylpyruvate dioxygenase-like putative hemolysin